MRQDIRLFIGDREVEFNSVPQILYNYTETDLRNPTMVKNSFSKSISIEGTKNNNDIFGHFWNLERYQDYGGSSGPAFNPLTKTDFSLYVGGALYEKGYCKLNNIDMGDDGNINYSVTLFGNLGNFFSRLTYQTESEDNAKLSLADLDYDFVDDGIESTISEWRINKDEVWNAWGTICNYGDTNSARYRMINYVPTYGGAPDNFSNDKVLINYNNGLPTDIFRDLVVDNSTAYRPVNGYALGNYDGDLTPWVTFDLRSYLMQPAVKMRYIIDACGNPAINGGYELDLDPHFFNDDNVYYNSSWMTLPSFASLNLSEAEEQTISGGATLQRQSGSRSGDLFNVVYTGQTLSKINNAKLTLNVGFTPSDSTTATTLYTDTYLYSNAGFNRTQIYKSAGGCIVQLWALDISGKIVGSSNAYLLSSTRNKANSTEALWWNYYNANELDTPASYTWLDGVWKKVNGSFTFCSRNGDPIGLEFTLNNSVEYDRLVMKIKWPYSYYTMRERSGRNAPEQTYYPDNNQDNYYEVNATGFPMYTTETATGSTNYGDVTQMFSVNRVRGAFNYNITSFEISAAEYGDFISNSKITKKILLGGDKTPADILLSFAKMFGLYFYYDPTEESSNPALYPNGVVHLMDRDTFFTDEQVNIEELIDHNKKQTILPTIASSKWLSFDLEQIESQANNDYSTRFGNYGRQLVNTSYNYDLGTTDLYDGNSFKGGVMVREKNPLYSYGGASYGGEVNVNYDFPIYITNKRFTYMLFNNNDSLELNVGGYLSSVGNNINNLGLKNYDSFPKLQCHTEDNKPSDGSGVLLFLNGFHNTLAQFSYWYIDHWETQDYPIDYHITDDVQTMVTLNDSSPCYIFTMDDFDTNGNRIARTINSIPNFNRDWINGGAQEGFIVHSWNFGHPQETFVPNVYSTEGDSIYDKTWKSYIKDLYDVNTKSFTTNVKFNDVSVALLRKYYWYKNGLWRLNSIKDYNVNSYDTTQCEFIKVQDPENYKLDTISAGGIHRIQLDSYNIGYAGGTINGSVFLQGGGTWYRGDVVKIVYENGDVSNVDSSSYVSPYSRTGVNTTFSVTIPQNTTNYTRRITIYIEYEDYTPMQATITQGTNSSTAYLAWVIGSDETTIDARGGWVDYNYNATNIVTSSIGVTTTADWITDITITTQYNAVFVETTPNESEQPRTAVLTITGTTSGGQTLTDSTILTQTSADLFIQPTEIVFDYDEDIFTDRQRFLITTEGGWTITTNDEE